MEDATHSHGSASRMPRTPVKPVLLIRLTSSHEDITPGFSFSKAKSPQPLNLGDKAKQIKSSEGLANASKPDEVPRTTSKSDSRTEAQNTLRLSKAASNVPFPQLENSLATNAPSQQPQSKPLIHECIGASSQEQERMYVGTDTIIKSGSKLSGDLCTTKSNVEVGDGHDVPRIPNVTTESRNRGDKSEPPKPVKKKHSSLGHNVTTKLSQWTNAEEDAIHISMFNREKLLQHCDNILAKNQVQEKEIINLKEVESILKTELHDAHQCIQKRDAELKEMQILKPKLQARVRRFKDYLNGLCDEHLQLKAIGQKFADISQEMRDEHHEYKNAIGGTKIALIATQDATKHERESFYKAIAVRDHQKDIDEQTLLCLKEQLDQTRSNSEIENARSESLDRAIEQTRSEHEQLKLILANNHNELATNLMQLLQSLSQPPTADLGIAEIVPMLQKCTDILESRQKQKFLGPSDLEHLHKSVKEEKDIILTSIKSLGETATESLTVSRHLTKQIEEVLTEKVLSEQLYLAEIAQKELQKELIKTREQNLESFTKQRVKDDEIAVLKIASLKSDEQSREAIANQNIQRDEISTLKAALLKKSHEEDCEAIARQKSKDEEIAMLKADLLKSDAESREGIVRQKLQADDFAILKAALLKKHNEEIREASARQKIRDEEIATLKASLAQKSEGERLENMAKLKIKEDELTTLKALLAKKSKDENLGEIARQKGRDEELSALKAALAKKVGEESLEIIAMQKVKDDEIATLKSMLEKAQTLSRTDDENSQVEEIPRDLMEIDGTKRPSWPLRSWSKTGTVTSETVAELFPAAPDPEMREIEDSQPQSRESQSKRPARQNITLDDLTARNTLSNTVGARHNVRTLRKRTAIVADLSDPYEPHQRKKRSSTRIHGSTADSQSPPRGMPQPLRPLRMTTTNNRKSNISKYKRKFDQYLPEEV